MSDYHILSMENRCFFNQLKPGITGFHQFCLISRFLVSSYPAGQEKNNGTIVENEAFISLTHRPSYRTSDSFPKRKT